MLQGTNLILNRNFKIRNFEEDKIATLEANPGLRYDGKVEGFYRFSGNFFLKDKKGCLIESFGIILLLSKAYPNVFPIVFSIDGKIETSDDFHISKDGAICVEHTYVTNKLVSGGLRLYDFIDYYLPKYFSWVLLKQSGITLGLKEWGHNDSGTIQVYEELLNNNDRKCIKKFLENYLSVAKIGRNDKCYCGNNKKLKNCHYEAALFLKATPKKTIMTDFSLFT